MGAPRQCLEAPDLQEQRTNGPGKYKPVVALASLEVRLAENALDQSVLLAQKSRELGLTGQNRSSRRGLPSAPVTDLVVAMSLGFDEPGQPYSAGCDADL